MYIFKTTEHEMRLSNAKPFNEKMRQELVKIWKRIAIFQHFQLLILKQKKTQTCFVGTKILNNSQSTAIST